MLDLSLKTLEIKREKGKAMLEQPKMLALINRYQTLCFQILPLFEVDVDKHELPGVIGGRDEIQKVLDPFHFSSSISAF
ncbi:hypothetical protein COLO4_38151 [Corchorus olitorius]|uniref:Uncharacterized protein n=1 Tax=Corchorus olitorius TaxID=93759 RepID=A0A1R3FWP0_9ROSI|nr:hypothetical protein COLO4_38151 [Corchorus olitorius]